jgi:ATP-binding cassette subfamily A (ABC1) protein 1
MTTTILDSLSDEEPDLKLINSILKPSFIVLFPHYDLGQGFLEMTILYNKNQINILSGRNTNYNPFFFDNIGKYLTAMFIQGLFYNILNILAQYKFFIKAKTLNTLVNLNIPKKSNEDSDVIAEYSRLTEEITASKKAFPENKNFTSDHELLDKELFIKKNDVNTDYVKLVNLTKVFKKMQNFKIKQHVAVNNLSLGIKRGECFGLIGVNGAGMYPIIYLIY